MHAVRTLTVSWLMACLTAFQFLTRFPLPITIRYTDKLFRRSTVFFPFVGCVIGLILILACAGLREWLPGFPAAIILMCLWIIITGATHLIGLMVTVDTIVNPFRKQMLEPVKDGRVGAVGVIVCVVYLLLKLSFIMELVDGSWSLAAVFLFCTPIWSRWFISIAIIRYPYARIGSIDLGALIRNMRLRHVIGAACIGFLLSLGSLWIFGFSGVELVCYSLGFPLATGMFGWCIAHYLSQKLSGLTGDAYGAINELLELFLLFTALILWN